MHDRVPQPRERERFREPGVVGDAIVEHRTRWRLLSQRYLRFSEEGSLWRYSGHPAAIVSEQGWKVHVSATVLSACGVLEAVARCLAGTGVIFKCAATLDELAKLNSGIWYGYTQIGKFITIYPKDDPQFRAVIAALHGAMPVDVAAPPVPFDHRSRSGSNVYFRYGSFVNRTTRDMHGDEVPAITAPNGDTVPDRRDAASPGWFPPPVPPDDPEHRSVPQTPLSTRYLIYRSLSQRGKGGVYEAIDAGAVPPRFCVIKEGRRDGETAWDGRDGRDRAENEARVLAHLRARGVRVPRVLDRFRAEKNFYTVLEKLPGKTLDRVIAESRSRLELLEAVRIGKEMASLIERTHAAGWAWRDCKPSNFVVGPGGRLTMIDLEGACPTDEPDSLPWATPNFSAPEVVDRLPARSNGRAHQDLYALGVCLFLLLEGRLPVPRGGSESAAGDPGTGPETADHPPAVGRCCVPGSVKSLTEGLLRRDPETRPSAGEAYRILRAAERDLLKQRRESRVAAHGVEERLDLDRR